MHPVLTFDIERLNRNQQTPSKVTHALYSTHDGCKSHATEYAIYSNAEDQWHSHLPMSISLLLHALGKHSHKKLKHMREFEHISYIISLTWTLITKVRAQATGSYFYTVWKNAVCYYARLIRGIFCFQAASEKMMHKKKYSARTISIGKLTYLHQSRCFLIYIGYSSANDWFRSNLAPW